MEKIEQKFTQYITHRKLTKVEMDIEVEAEEDAKSMDEEDEET